MEKRVPFGTLAKSESGIVPFDISIGHALLPVLGVDVRQRCHDDARQHLPRVDRQTRQSAPLVAVAGMLTASAARRPNVAEPIRDPSRAVGLGGLGQIDEPKVISGRRAIGGNRIGLAGEFSGADA
jgi:hypothetical protein